MLTSLTATAKTRHQLAELLAKRNIPDEVAESVLDRFVEVGLIDDRAFARNWVLSRAQTRGLARTALSRELKQKGVAPDLIAEALEELTYEDEEAQARRLIEAKARSLSGLTWEKKFSRITGLLSRKGYPSGLAMRLAREYASKPDNDD